MAASWRYVYACDLWIMSASFVDFLSAGINKEWFCTFDLGGCARQPAKVYKVKHLSKVEVVQNDPSGCTFLLVWTPPSHAHNLSN
jgi:hypothetical protein